MTWRRSIRILFSSALVVFTYIIFSILANGFGNMAPGYEDFIIAFVIMALVQFMEQKNINKYVLSSVAFVTNFLLFYLVHGRMDFIPYSFLGIVIILTLLSNDPEVIIYNYFFSKLKVAFLVLAFSIILYVKVDLNYAYGLLRYYIFFFLLAVLTLREARKFEYRIPRKKKDNVFNLSIVAFIVLFSTDFVMDAAFKVIGYIFKGIGFVYDKLLDVILFILRKPIEIIINFFQGLMLKSGNSKENPMINNPDVLPGLDKIKNEQAPAYIAVEVILRIIFVLILLFIIYKIIQRYRYGKVLNKDGVEEIRERIETKEQGRKIGLKDRLRDLVRATNSREKILNIYKDFQIKSYKKGKFKKYMTARQLYNISKVNLDNPEELKYLTELYNEAKFSDHPIEEEAASKAKKVYENIKTHI